MEEKIKIASQEIEDHMNSPEGVVIDAGNQFIQFKMIEAMSGIDEVKRMIVEISNDKDNSLKTLEDYIIHKDYYRDSAPQIIESIKKFKPTVFEKYNNLIERLKSPNLTHEEFLKILEESKALI